MHMDQCCKSGVAAGAGSSCTRAYADTDIFGRHVIGIESQYNLSNSVQSAAGALKLRVRV